MSTSKNRTIFKLENIDFQSCIGSIISSVKRFWDPPLLQHYTNHDLRHSERIIDVLEALLDEHQDPLNETEKFVLMAAIYLHDIGMQSPLHAGINKTHYTLEDMELIRKVHHETSAQMIRESIAPDSDLDLGLGQCKDYVDVIAKVAMYHRKMDLDELQDTHIGGVNIRVPLLAALIRLGDELDADYRRVNMEALKLWNIPVNSKFHWWAHHYVKSVNTEHGHIRLYFRFPEEYIEDDVTDEFQKKMYESIKRQFLEVYDVLESYGIRLYRDVTIEPEEYASTGILELIPVDLRTFIDENIRTLKETSDKMTEKTGVTWEVDGVIYSDDSKAVESMAKIFQLLYAEKNKDAETEIEYGNTLIMGPKEKMIFSINAGNCYYILGKLEKAEMYYQQGLKIAERRDLNEIYKSDVSFTRSAALGNLGVIQKDQGDLNKALKYNQDALEIHSEIGDMAGKAMNMINIGLIYLDKGEANRALEYIQKALKISKELTNNLIEATCLGNMGLVYHAKGDLEESMRLYASSLTIIKKEQNKLREAEVLTNIGNIFKDQNLLDQALDNYQQSLRIFREISYRNGEAAALSNIGNIYNIKKDQENALMYQTDALKINQEIHHRKGEADNLVSIGLIYERKKELEKAIEYFQRGLKIYRKIGYKEGIAIALNNIGLIYSRKNDLDKAHKNFLKALEMIQDIDLLLKSKILANMAIVYFRKHDYNNGFENLAKALTTATHEELIRQTMAIIISLITDLVKNVDWENMEKIDSMYKTGIIGDKEFVNALTVIHKFAVFKRTGKEEHKKKYQNTRKRLDPESKKFVKKVLGR